MAYITVGSTFTPFTYEEKVRPFMQYNEAYNDIEDKYLTMQERAAQVGALIDPTISPEAYKIYQNYQNAIQTAFDDLYGNGLTNANRAMFSNIRKEQVPALNSLTSDIARSEKAKEAFDKVWYGKEHDFIGRNPHDTSLDEWLGGKTPNIKGLSSSELSAYVAAGTKAASDRAYQTFIKNGYRIDKTGLNQSEVDSLIYALNTGSKFEDKTATGKYLNNVLNDVIEFIDTDVYSRFGFNNEDEFTQQNLDEINAAINYGLRIGFTHDQKVTPISTGKDGKYGNGDGGITDPYSYLNSAKEGISLHTSAKDAASTQNNTKIINRINEYNVDGHDLLVDYRTYNRLLEEYNAKYEKYKKDRRRYLANARITDYGKDRSWTQPEPDRSLVDAFEAALGKDTIKTISKIEKDKKITFNDSSDFIDFYSDYSNRVIEVPSIEVVGPSTDDRLRNTIAEAIFTNMTGSQQFEDSKDASSIKTVDGYKVDKSVEKKKLKEIIGDNGENITQVSLNLEGLLNDSTTAYALITTSSGRPYYIPIQYISPSLRNSNGKSFIYNILTQNGIKDIESFRKWDNNPELLKKVNDIINGKLTTAIRGLYNEPYYTGSPSKGNI